MTHPEHLRDEDADKLHRLRKRDPELDQLTLHVRKFAAMMTGRHGDRLEDWITNAERDTRTPLAGFARNLRRDFDAVRYGLSLPHSSGAVEGNINRLKMLKRQMFSRASLDLLRKRVTARPRQPRSARYRRGRRSRATCPSPGGRRSGCFCGSSGRCTSAPPCGARGLRP